jgi:hypothetical protein
MAEFDLEKEVSVHLNYFQNLMEMRKFHGAKKGLDYDEKEVASHIRAAVQHFNGEKMVLKYCLFGKYEGKVLYESANKDDIYQYWVVVTDEEKSLKTLWVNIPSFNSEIAENKLEFVLDKLLEITDEATLEKYREEVHDLVFRAQAYAKADNFKFTFIPEDDDLWTGLADGEKKSFISNNKSDLRAAIFDPIENDGSDLRKLLRIYIPNINPRPNFSIQIVKRYNLPEKIIQEMTRKIFKIVGTDYVRLPSYPYTDFNLYLSRQEYHKGYTILEENGKNNPAAFLNFRNGAYCLNIYIPEND